MIVFTFDKPCRDRLIRTNFGLVSAAAGDPEAGLWPTDLATLVYRLRLRLDTRAYCSHDPRIVIEHRGRFSDCLEVTTLLIAW